MHNISAEFSISAVSVVQVVKSVLIQIQHVKGLRYFSTAEQQLIRQ